MYFNFTPQVVCRSFLCVPVNSSKPTCIAKAARFKQKPIAVNHLVSETEG
jgi:hypothetical protein